MTHFFERISARVASAAGQPHAFILASLTIIIWGLTGPLFRWSDTWQLVINTGTTIVTFLMVFLIQNAQNRDGSAIQAKLDELIRAGEKPATNSSALSICPSVSWSSCAACSKGSPVTNWRITGRSKG